MWTFFCIFLFCLRQKSHVLLTQGLAPGPQAPCLSEVFRHGWCMLYATTPPVLSQSIILYIPSTVSKKALNTTLYSVRTKTAKGQSLTIEPFWPRLQQPFLRANPQRWHQGPHGLLRMVSSDLGGFQATQDLSLFGCPGCLIR